MKTLRITCFLSAAYFALHSGFLYFSNWMEQFMENNIPADQIQGNPILRANAASQGIALQFLPWLAIGVGVCLVLGFLTRVLWRLIPVVAVLLFLSCIVWVYFYHEAMQPYYTEMTAAMGNQLPGAFGAYYKQSVGNSRLAMLYPVLVPGFVIFVFWWKSRSEAPVQKVY